MFFKIVAGMLTSLLVGDLYSMNLNGYRVGETKQLRNNIIIQTMTLDLKKSDKGKQKFPPIVHILKSQKNNSRQLIYIEKKLIPSYTSSDKEIEVVCGPTLGIIDTSGFKTLKTYISDKSGLPSKIKNEQLARLKSLEERQALVVNLWTLLEDHAQTKKASIVVNFKPKVEEFLKNRNYSLEPQSPSAANNYSKNCWRWVKSYERPYIG